MRLAPMNAERSMPYRPTAADIIDTSAQRLDMADDVSDDGSAARFCFSGRGRSDGAVVPRAAGYAYVRRRYTEDASRSTQPMPDPARTHEPCDACGALIVFIVTRTQR